MSKPLQNLAAKNSTFVRSIQQWRAGSITVERAVRKKRMKEKEAERR
jgi:hypothetical protein